MAGSADRLGVEVEQDGDAVTVRVAGEVDMSNAESLAEQLLAGLRGVRAPAPLVADLGGITFLGTSGLSALLEVNDRCRADGVPLRVVASHPVRRAVEVSGLGSVLDLYESAAEALA